VISWPVAVNDEIVTQAAPAMLRFTDGTVVTLQRNSRIRLNQGPSGVEVNMLSGSAIYDLKPRSNVSVANTMSAVNGATTSHAASMAGSVPAVRIVPGNEAIATALAHDAPSSGMVISASDVKTGTFSHMGPTPKQNTLLNNKSDTITLANGTILEVHLVTGGGPGGKSTYVIDRILFAIPDTGRPCCETIYLTTPKGADSPLIGASFVVPGGLTPAVGVNLNVFLLNGTPLTPAQLANLLQQAANAAFSDPLNKYVPPGATPPQFTGPITIGVLSGNAT
jgi:FecR protein